MKPFLRLFKGWQALSKLFTAAVQVLGMAKKCEEKRKKEGSWDGGSLIGSTLRSLSVAHVSRSGPSTWTHGAPHIIISFISYHIIHKMFKSKASHDFCANACKAYRFRWLMGPLETRTTCR